MQVTLNRRQENKQRTAYIPCTTSFRVYGFSSLSTCGEPYTDGNLLLLF
jgi:hypothetical protein